MCISHKFLFSKEKRLAKTEMSFLPSLSASGKNHQTLEIPGPDQNQDTNAILPPIKPIKVINTHNLATQNPAIRMPQAGKKNQSGPRTPRQYQARISCNYPMNSTLNSGASTNIPNDISGGISLSATLMPKSPLNAFRKRNGNPRKYKNNNNIILPPLDDINSFENDCTDEIQQQAQTNDKLNYLPSDVGDVYTGNGNELSDDLEEEDEDELFLHMNNGRLESHSNRIDDETDIQPNGFYSIQVSDPKFSS